MSRLERRLSKVEAAFSAPELLITREEVHVASLRIALAIYKSNSTPDLRRRAEKLASGLIEEIVSTVKIHCDEEFKQHLANVIQQMWIPRVGSKEFLPPICGSVNDDWEVPDLYQRRVAMRHFPLVVALIGPPDQALGPPKYVIRWDEIAENIRQGGREARASVAWSSVRRAQGTRTT